MEVLLSVGSQMIVLFAVMAVGAACRKTKLFSDEFESRLSGLVMKVALPCMIIDSVLSNTDLPSAATLGEIALVSTGVYVLVCPIAFLIVRFLFHPKNPSSKGVYAFMISFGNTGFIGFPLVNAILGSEAVLYAAIFNIFYNFFMFSVGIMFLKKMGDNDEKSSLKEDAKELGRALLTPVMISSVIAMMLALARITDQGVVGQAFGLIGQMTVPCAMLLVGSSLAKQSPRQMLGDGWVYVASLLRLVAVPLLVWGLGSLLVSDTYLLGIVALVCATPVASIATMLSITYGGDAQAMARGTFISTLLSIITLPIMATIVL